MPIPMELMKSILRKYLVMIMATIPFFVSYLFILFPRNHDYNSVNNLEDPSIHKGPYFDIVEVFKNAEMGGVPSNTEVYYSYDIGNTYFLALNSEVWKYLFSWI